LSFLGKDTSLEGPDFRSAANQLRGVADELERCANLPVVDSGQAVLDALGQLQADLGEVRGFTARFDAVEGRLAAL
jgi:hypothetical protein